MNTMSQILEPQETYYITNARVACVDAKFRVLTENKYQWIINVLGIVVDHLQTKTISTKYGPATIQDFVIVDDGENPTLLTLWNEVLFSEGPTIVDAIERMPIMAGTRLNVTEYHGVSLSARGSSGIILDPPYPDAQRLKTWKSKNQVLLVKLLQEKKYLEKSINHLAAANRNYSTLAAIIMSNSEGIFWAKAAAKIVDESQQFWYMACQNCLKRTAALYQMDICCNFCLGHSVAVPRTKFSVLLVDETTTLEVVVFGDAAEKLFQKTPIEVMNCIEQGEFNYSLINSSLEGRKFNFQLKKKSQQSGYCNDHQYTTSVADEDLIDLMNMGPREDAGSSSSETFLKKSSSSQDEMIFVHSQPSLSQTDQ